MIPPTTYSYFTGSLLYLSKYSSFLIIWLSVVLNENSSDLILLFFILLFLQERKIEHIINYVRNPIISFAVIVSSLRWRWYRNKNQIDTIFCAPFANRFHRNNKSLPSVFLLPSGSPFCLLRVSVCVPVLLERSVESSL